MKIYRVGGAVRDTLLGLPVKDNDWVVVGATPEDLLARGYRPIGRDFPVFLHPDTQEQYALARTERKAGHGYAGFVFHAAPDVTLAQDLLRRDLTINAIAQDAQGALIDPYGGQADLEHRLLRHVSPAFAEDPLRILRVARLAARLHPYGFTIAQATQQLMVNMVNNGEVNYLVPERVCQETLLAIMTPAPRVYFEVLNGCGALQALMPTWHTLLQANPHALTAMMLAAQDDASERIRFACLFPPCQQLNHKALVTFYQQMRFPKVLTDRGRLLFRYHAELLAVLNQPTGKRLMAVFSKTDAFRKPDQCLDSLQSSYYLAKAAGQSLPWQRVGQLAGLLSRCRAINAGDIIAQGVMGKQVGQQLQRQRLQLLNQMIDR